MLRDLRIAVRTLRSWRFGAIAAVMTLAVAIGTTTSMYAMLQTVLAASSTQIEDTERLARVYASNPATGQERGLIALGDFKAVLVHTQSFEAIAASSRTEMAIGSGQDGDQLSVTIASPEYFHVFRARAAIGRLFTSADFENSTPVALVSTGVWRRRFAGRSLADVPTIVLNGIERQVVGVLPAEFEFSLIGVGGDAWIPMTGTDAQATTFVSIIARLKPERGWSTALAELSALTPPAQRGSGWRWHLIPVQQDSRHRTLTGTTATLVPALIVLLIGCVNVACMLLARGIERSTELSVRAALGASRGTIFRQLVIENLALAVAGGIAGATLAAGIVRLIAASSFVAAKPGLAERLSGDLSLLPVAIVSSIIACLLFGTWPALRLSRRDVSATLKGTDAPERVRVAGYGARDLVVFFELGLAVMLVLVTAMWFSFFSALQNVTLSFAADELIVVPVSPADRALVCERVSALPGVEHLTVASAPPGILRSSGTEARTNDGRTGMVGVIDVDERYFAATGVTILRGRSFDRAEAAGNAPVVIVSEGAAKSLWPDTDPIDQEVQLGGPGNGRRVTVIGVARDAAGYAALGLQPGEVYRPLEPTRSRTLSLLVRARNAHTMTRSIAAAARLSQTAPMPRVTVVRDGIAGGPAESVGLIRILGGFSLIALLLAGSGIFGVISQSVAQRRTEFGVRVALGASRAGVLRMVTFREGKLIAAALTVATVGTVAVARTLFAELVSISAMNPAWPVGLIALCGGVAAVALGFATYRILKLEPAEVLRKI